MQILHAAPVFEHKMQTLKQLWSRIDAKKKASFHIAFVQFGFDKATQHYGQSFGRLCYQIGIHAQHLVLPDNISLESAQKEIQHLNQDHTVHGILLQQPLPRHLSCLLDELDSKKDIEAMTAKNLGLLMLEKGMSYPCTPMAVMELIRFYNISLEGEDVCIIGRSKIVGLPLAILLTQAGATVTICHSKTRNIKEKTRRSNLVIVAVGKPNLIDSDYVSPHSCVIDVGTNYTSEGLVGDVSFESLRDKVAKISPVPGGVGKLTPLILLENCIKSCL